MSDSQTPPLGLHQGRQACTALLRNMLLGLAPAACTPWGGVREVWLADPDFADWPLDEPEVHGALAAWLRQGGRQLRIASLQFDKVARHHPRLARWRRDWSHAISAWSPTEGGLPCDVRGLLVAPLWLQRLDAPDWRMACTGDVPRAKAVQAEIADFLQRCEPSWPATTLGL